MSITGEMLNGVGLWITRRERQEERDDAAVGSVLDAVNKTKLYLSRRERGEDADRDVESELVGLWTTASVHIRRTDVDLAQRLGDKADYWTNPESWTAEQVAAKRIQIDEIDAAAKRLLGDV